MRDVNIRGTITSGLVVVLAACGTSGEPADGGATSPSSAPTAAVPTASPEPVAGTDPAEWCEQWWETVVEADDENSAAGAALLLATDGVDLADEVIADRSEVLDYSSGGSPTEEEIQRAIEDIGTACAVHIAVD